MKAATITQIKKELKERDPEELIDLCLNLAKFKKDNKELLTYLLYESADEDEYIRLVKEEMDEQFDEINTHSYYYMKKTIRKILRNVKKQIRYSKKKETEIALLTHFCEQMLTISPSIQRNTTLSNLYNRQIKAIEKAISYLHEDLQYDYSQSLEKLIIEEY